MTVNYTPVSRQQIESRKKTGVTALTAGVVTRLVSAALSGMIRHVVGVALDNRSGQGQVQLMIADASGLTSVIERIELPSTFTSGKEYKDYAEWHPPKKEQPYYDLGASEQLFGVIDSGYAHATIQHWDENFMG